MAIATLSSCYNNPLVFQGVVKIRKGQAVTLMMEATNMRAVQNIISQYSQEVSVFFFSPVLKCGGAKVKICSENNSSKVITSTKRQRSKLVGFFFPCRFCTRSRFRTRHGTKRYGSWRSFGKNLRRRTCPSGAN